MKINIQQFQGVCQKANSSSKKSVEDQVSGFEDIMFQMVSMMNIESSQNLKDVGLDEKSSLEHKTHQNISNAIENNEIEAPILNINNNIENLQENKHSQETEIHPKEEVANRKIAKPNPFLGENNEHIQNSAAIKTPKIISEITVKEEVANIDTNKRSIYSIEQQAHKESSVDITFDKSQSKKQQDDKISIKDIKVYKAIKEMEQTIVMKESYKPINKNKLLSVAKEIESLDKEMGFNKSQDKTTDQILQLAKEEVTFQKAEDVDISRENFISQELYLNPEIMEDTPIQYIERGEPKIEQVHIKNMDEIAYDMIKEVETLKEGEKSSLNMKLKPKELGEIEITLEIKTGQVIGKIFVEDMAIKGALESQLQNLKDNLNNQDIILKDLEITLQQNTQEQSQNQEKENHFFNQGQGSTNRILRQEAEEEIADTSHGYQSPIGNPYYSSQSSSLNFLA